MNIKEELLHYLWRTHKLAKIGLQTTSGQHVEIVRSGALNPHDGPDFLNAQIRIDNVLWVGAVEMHLRASDWFQHKHHLDKRYDSVILHVVLEDDKPVYVSGKPLPCLNIAPNISPELASKYAALMRNNHELACEPYSIENINESFFWMRDKLLAERMQRRLGVLNNLETGNKQLFYTLLMGALGGKANRLPFWEFSRKIHWTQISRWAQRPERIKHYLFYLSGLFEDELKHSPEWQLIATHAAEPMRREHWQFRQIRPAGRPQKRILEIATLIAVDFFAEILDAKDVFAFSDAWKNKIKYLRSGQIEAIQHSDFVIRNIALNAIAPFAFFKGMKSGDSAWFDFAFNHLDEWTPEQNSVIQIFSKKGILARTGGDTQALLELFQNYCTPKKCLSCAIGNELLRA